MTPNAFGVIFLKRRNSAVQLPMPI